MKLTSVCGLLAASFVLACGQHADSDRPQLAFVTNGIASFWTIAAAGVNQAAADLDVDCHVHMPAGGIVDQKSIVEDLLTRGVDGFAISPIDGVNQADLINEACERTHVITQDSDAPGTQRLCYVGMDNYVAGRECGKLVKEALPDGGSIMLFIGRLEQDNARRRRQGVIDELLERDFDSARYDVPGEVIQGDKYTILDTRTDQFDRTRAKGNAEDALAAYPDLAAMVGLFAYNPPACLEALRAAGKLGEVKVIAFDEADETLQGILDDEVYGTVVQDPYRYGYESVRILTALAQGDRSVLPESGFLDVPARSIRKPDVRAFWDELNELTKAE